MSDWEQRSQQMMQLAAREEARLIGQAKQLLLALAESSQVRSGKQQECKQQLDEVMASYPRYANLEVAEARRRPATLLTAHDVRAPGPETEARQLSGGNQQKLVLARALEARPSVLLAENPTRGLDLAATAAVHDRLRQASADGIAVVVYSSDLDEVLALGCDRLLVVCRGQVTELPPRTARAAVEDAMLRGVTPA